MEKIFIFGNPLTNIITINTVSGGSGIRNNADVILYLTRIISTAVTNLSSTGGKLNVLNDTVVHAS